MNVLDMSLLSATWPERNPANTVKEEAEWLGGVMTRAYDTSMPRCRPMARRAAYWWSEDHRFPGWATSGRRGCQKSVYSPQAEPAEGSGCQGAPKCKERPQGDYKKGKGRCLGGSSSPPWTGTRERGPIRS